MGKLLDYSTLVLTSLLKRKLRSWLTMIGIFIGIAAVVSLITISQGLKESVAREFSAMGVDKIFILPKTAFGPTGDPTTPLTKDDTAIVKKSKGVQEVADMRLEVARVEHKDELRYTFLMSFLPGGEAHDLLKESFKFKVIQGRHLKRGDMFKTVIGYNLAHRNFFGTNLALRDKIIINNHSFEVIGILNEIGTTHDDTPVYISQEAMNSLYPETTNEVNHLVARVSAGEDVAAVAQTIKKDLRKHRNLDEGEEDFEVQTPEDVVQTFAIVLDIIQTVLVGIGFISLIVGGIGIMNTMYTAVLERTKEIGIMKSIGARNNDILTLFLIESGTLGIVGGVIGVTLGVGFGKLMEFAAASAGYPILKVYISSTIIIGALLFSFLVGAISGTLPALKASKLRPVDALRY